MRRFVFLFYFFTTLLSAEPRTFTDHAGHTVTAELVSVENNQVTIRRDDGQSFTLAIASLSDEDQKYLSDWSSKKKAADKQAPDEKFVPNPKKIVVGLSRGKFDSRTLAKFDGYIHKHEDWGYNVQIINKHLRPLEKIRFEYNLFARTFSDTTSPTMISGTKSIATLKAGGSETFRTQSTEVCKRRDIYFGNESGELRGIWIRLYVGDQLVSEQSSPESLMTKEKWSKPASD
jgi:hypothetical protein